MLFSYENSVGGNIIIHIIPREVVYFLGMHSYTINDNLITVNNETISIYNFFNMPSSQNFLLKNFN